MIPTLTLNNQVEIPQLGFGTYQIEDGKSVIDAVTQALEIGYRHIDTASAYENEQGVGQAIEAFGLPRSSVFVTTKLWNSDHGYDATLHAFDASLKRLNLDYLDLYLIHWPLDMALVPDTWRAFERLYEEGLVRAIGVSNFHQQHLAQLVEQCQVLPAINQVECHLALQQKSLYDYCSNLKITLEAWSPLMKGRAMDITLVTDLAEKYQKTPAQIILRWHLQRGVIAIPKSVTTSRIKENFKIGEFKLTEDEMTQLAKLDTHERVGSNPDVYRKMSLK